MAPVSCPEYSTRMPAVKRRGVLPCVIVLVGEPARERTSLAHSLRRYLTWTQHQVKVFSYGSDLMSKSYEMESSSQQFNSSSAYSNVESVNSQAVFDAKTWILAQENNSFAILDGNHATVALRQAVHSVFSEIGAKVLFIEFTTNAVNGINKNIMDILNLHEDYSRMGLKEDDIKKILENFGNSHYIPLGSTPSENSFSYLKYVDSGDRFIANKFPVLECSRILKFVSHYKPHPKVIYFSRHGESEYNLLGRIGGNAVLSERGQKYAQELARYFNQENRHSDLKVWTSRKIRTIQTGSLIQAPTKQLPEIDEIDAGVCEGMTYEEVAEKYPKEMAKRDADKLGYRYPQGESYIDLMQRLENVLLEIQNTDNPLLVISHQAVLRPVLAYFCPPNSLDEIPYINVPLHTLIKLTQEENEYKIEYIKFNIECVNTFRQKPQNCSLNRSNEDALSTVPAHLDAVR